MSDIADWAQVQEEWFRSQALDARQAAACVLPFTGRCYNCEDQIEWGDFFDPDCRDDYQLRKKQEAQKVRP